MKKYVENMKEYEEIWVENMKEYPYHKADSGV
mgnify:CR=1 FL=1